MSGGGARLLTFLLAAMVGWAVVAALAVYGGLGQRYTLHPDDPTLAPAPPPLNLARVETRLAPIEAYAEVSARPLFNADRQPIPIDASTGEEAEAEEAPPPEPLDVTLTSVILSGDFAVAMITDNQSKTSQSVRLGSHLEGDRSAWRLVKLQPRAAVFEGPTGEMRVELRVFDGTGGVAPTPVASTEGQPQEESQNAEEGEAMDPESRAEMIRRRIEERRRQMREEAARAAAQDG